MAKRSSQLYAASFRGIRFLVRSEGQTGNGRKLVFHDFPNSDDRYIEDLGQLSPNFRISAEVHGDDFLTRASALKNALNTAGSGELILPNFGSVNVWVGEYEENADQTRVGIIKFEISFHVGKSTDTKIQSSVTQDTVYANGDAARESLQASFAESFTIPESADDILKNAEDLQKSTNSIVSSVESSLNPAQLSQLQRAAVIIARTAVSLVKAPERLAGSLISSVDETKGIWQIISEGFSARSDISKAAASAASLVIATSYGADLSTGTENDGSAVNENSLDETSDTTPYWPNDTFTREVKNDNRRLFVRNIRINAVIALFEVLSAKEYQTIDEINQARTTLENAYKNVFIDGLSDPESVYLDQSFRTAIETLRVSSLQILSEKAQQVYRIVTIQKNAPISAFILAHNVYAEQFKNTDDLTERSEVIRALNPDQNGMQMVGDISVLQQ